jgi:hypothetical protein
VPELNRHSSLNFLSAELPGQLSLGVPSTASTIVVKNTDPDRAYLRASVSVLLAGDKNGEREQNCVTRKVLGCAQLERRRMPAGAHRAVPVRVRLRRNYRQSSG